MRSFQASGVGLKLGLVLACAAFAALRWRYPVFFGEGSEDALGFVFTLVAAPTALGFVLGLFTKRGGAIAIALTALAIGGAFAALLLPTPSPAGIGAVALGCAIIAGLVASHASLAKRRATYVCAALALLVAGSTLLAPRAPRAEVTSHPKLLFYGLDAGTWTILNQLFEHDELPNLRRLRDDGTSGILLSELESASPRVWTTIATGKNPAKHGI